MKGTEDKGVIYEFEGFALDPGERTLTVNGAPVHLPAKEFDTLLYLIENRGRALTKEEMLSAIWHDSFVEEVNLAKQISRLRKVLSDGGAELIETIPKHGYRFRVTDVRVREPDPLEPLIVEKRTVKRIRATFPESDEVTETAPPHSVGLLPGKTPGRLWWTVPILLVLAAALGVYFWISTGRTGDTQVRSIAVLPFRLVGTAADEEYLRVGLSDAVVTKLSGLKGIVVRPTNAVRPYSDHEPVSAGRLLGVDVVLDGNIQRVDRQIRLTVQLISVRDGTIIWGGRFDDQVANIFALQDAISEQVADAIRPDLTGEERSLLTKRFTASNAAHAAYVKGRISWNRRTGRDLQDALGHFETAIMEDPNYALAHAGLADTYSLLADYNAALPHESYPKARAAATRALELDPQLAEAHTALAYVKMYYDWDWQGSERGFRRAIDLNPNYATAHQWYSEYLASQGRFDEALNEIRRAKEIDPLSPVINAGEVWVLYFARRYDEGIELGQRLAEREPKFAEVHEYLKRCYDAKGMYREAITARQMRRQLVGLDFTISSPLRAAAAATTKEEYWPHRLEQELEETKIEGPALWDLAEIHSQVGEPRLALEWLTKAVEARHHFVIYIKVAPNLDPIRSEPGYAEMIRRLGL